MGANLLGIDVGGLDVEGFLASGRRLFPLLAVAWVAALPRVRRPAWLLAGVVAANAYAWALTNYPLQRLYGLGASPDRVGNLGLCQVVAAGNSPLRTAQVGQLHFEPFWSFLVAVLSGFNPDRVLEIYPFLPLAMMAGFAMALYFGLAARDAGENWSPWERALIAGFATLLSSAPLEFAGTYRVPWAMTFLLKPNHALGLVLLPLVLRATASIRGWAGRLGAGVLLHLLGWVFVIHMAYVCAGLLVYLALSLLERRRDARRDVLDVAVVMGVNFLAVSPYLYMLLAGYPFLQSDPNATIPQRSAFLLEPTIRFAAVFALGLWGAFAAYRRGDRLGRLWGAQVLGALLVWAAYLPLSAFQLARERDEIYYWVRFLTAASAGIGAWDVAARCRRLALPASESPALRCAAIALLAIPWALPYWWDPSRMDSYFPGSLAPLPDYYRVPTDFLRQRTDPVAVVAGDRDYARYVAALGARRVLIADNFHAPVGFAQRAELEEALVRDTGGEALRAAERFGVRYLLVTKSLLSRYPGVTLGQIAARAHLRNVHSWRSPGGEFVAIYEIPRAPGPP